MVERSVPLSAGACQVRETVPVVADFKPAGLFAVDARADAIDISVTAQNRDFRTFAGFPGATFNDNRAVIDFRYFLLEQPHHQFRSGA